LLFENTRQLLTSSVKLKGKHYRKIKVATGDSMHAFEKKLIAVAKERFKRRIRYHEKVEARRIQEDAITRQSFLEQYPDWETKKDTLSPRYRKVIELSYGLDDKYGNKVLSLSKIGEIIGTDGINSSISRQRVQQIKNKALKILARG
jgi:DNA-directed RNA polymerase sigma subunit (sigma70/sigma32)